MNKNELKRSEQEILKLWGELVELKQECYFNRGLIPSEEWKMYQPRIKETKNKISEEVEKWKNQKQSE